MQKVGIAGIRGHGSNSVLWLGASPQGQHVAVEFDNKQTWYATVYPTEQDFLARQNPVRYREFCFRSQAVTWACQQLCGEHPEQCMRD